jgi:O-antigen/teichoic acid export membrane protein
MLTLAVVGKTLAVMALGDAWAEAGVYTQILGIWAFFWFISTPMSNLFFVLEKQEFLLRINVMLLITRLLSLGLGGYLGSARLALILFAGTGVFVYGYLCISILIYSGTAWPRIGSIFLQALSYFLPFGIILFLLIIVYPNNLIIVAATFVSFVAYGCILWFRQPDLVRGLIRR